MKYTSISALLVSAVAMTAAAGCSSKEVTPGVADSGVADTGVKTTLYDRLGGNSGIALAVDAIVADEVKDAEIAATFADNSAPKAGHPSVAQIKKCLVNQLAAAAGGTEKYPGVPGDNAGWQCRDMKTSHEFLAIKAELFDKFVAIAGGTLKRLGVADADITVVAGVLVSTKSDIVAGTTVGPKLYDRLGKKAGIVAAVDAIVAEEIKDPAIAATFADNLAPKPGNPSVAQIKACLVNQLAAASGGTERYPGVPADALGWQCRDMQSAHLGTSISATLFDKFVTIAGGVLTARGVSAADVSAVAAVLNSTKSDVVDPAAR
jgi:truncated hemoglobin YjbI